jgi:hypothetical protein
MSKEIYKVTLTEEERAYLQGLVSKGRVAAHKRIHAQILLKTDAGPQGENWKEQQIVDAFDVNPRTVERVRQRFVEYGLEAAINRKKQEEWRIPKIDGKVEAHLIAAACSLPPPGRCRWTLRLLAGHLVELELVESVSHETVRQALKKTNLSLG